MSRIFSRHSSRSKMENLYQCETKVYFQEITFIIWFGLVLWHINHCRLLMPNPFLNINSSISNNSVLQTKTVTFQAIQFSISTQFSSIWPIVRTLSGTTTPGQSKPESDGNEEVRCIPQSSSITGTSPSDCLGSYPRHSWWSLTPLQRCSQCILQPQLTGKFYHLGTADYIQSKSLCL